MATYLEILQQIEHEIRDKIQRLETERKNLQIRLHEPEVRKLYLCIWEDKLSLISESELPDGLTWADYERIVLVGPQEEIHAAGANRADDLKRQLDEIEIQLKAWRFAYAMVESYQEST